MGSKLGDTRISVLDDRSQISCHSSASSLNFTVRVSPECVVATNCPTLQKSMFVNMFELWQSWKTSIRDVQGIVVPSVCTTMLSRPGKVAAQRVKRLRRLMVLKLRENWSCHLEALLNVTTSLLVRERSLAAGELTCWSLNSSMSTLMMFWA